MNADNYAGISSLIGFAKVAAFTLKNYLLDSRLISVLWVLFFVVVVVVVCFVFVCFCFFYGT